MSASQINAGTVMTRAYAYDTRNLITSNGVRTFGYDAVGRLIHAQPSTGPATDYTYDANGNRLTLTYGTYAETYSYAPQTNRLYQVAGNDSTTGAISMNPRGETTLDTKLFSGAALVGDDFQFTRAGALAAPGQYDILIVNEQFNHLHQRIEDARTLTLNSTNTNVVS